MKDAHHTVSQVKRGDVEYQYPDDQAEAIIEYTSKACIPTWDFSPRELAVHHSLANAFSRTSDTEGSAFLIGYRQSYNARCFCA